MIFRPALPAQQQASSCSRISLCRYRNTKKTLEAIKKLEYVVVLDTMMSELAELADIVIPGSHLPGKMGDTWKLGYLPATSIRQPVVKSVINGMTEQEFILAWQ